MKTYSWTVFLLIVSSSALFGQARLIYHHNGNSYVVDGFDFTRPFYQEAGENRYLPIEGEWGMEIENDQFWENCHFPRSYYLNKVHRVYAVRNGEASLSIGFDGDTLPVSDGVLAKEKNAVSWSSTDFKESVVVLGWFFNGEVTSLEIVRTNKPIHSGLMDALFKGFQIKESHADGFPFFCVIGQGDLELRSPKVDFSKDNTDYLYRLACRGSASDFEAVEMSSRELARIKVLDKFSLMHGAALYGNVEVLKYLNQIKADKIRRDKEVSVVRQAVFGRRLNSMKELIEQGHDPLESSKLFHSNYQIAIQMGDFRMVDYLSDDIRFLKHKTSKAGNSLEVAVSSLRPAIYKMLVQKAESSGLGLEVKMVRPNVGGEQYLFNSNCSMGNLGMIRAMIDLEVDVNTESRGSTPLRAAVQSGNAKLVQFLIENGAVVNGTFGSNKSTYLHYASQSGHPEIIKVLVEAGLDINVLDARGRTPLYLAVLSKKVSSVHELLGLGADPNVRPEKRPPAVWMAVIQDERESIQSLIQYGAECELDDTLAMQLMDYALAFDIPEVVQISLEQCLTPDFSFRGKVPGIWVANYYDAVDSKDVLTDAGADLSSKPSWKFEKPKDAFVDSLADEQFAVQYPKHLREKYGDLKVKVEMIIDPTGKVRFPKFLEPLPWDLRLFLRESIRAWVVDLPHADDLNTAYRVRLPLELKTEDFGVKVFQVGELDQPPAPIKRIAPVYPRELKKNRVQGYANIVFIVDEEGSVTDVSIEKTNHREFGINAESAVRQWKFKPGFKDGSPVKTYVRIPLSFTLRK